MPTRLSRKLLGIESLPVFSLYLSNENKFSININKSFLFLFQEQVFGPTWRECEVLTGMEKFKNIYFSNCEMN